MTIAVTAASGQLGRLVVKALKQGASALVALARSPQLADLGVEAREADYAKPTRSAGPSRACRHSAAHLLERDRPARRTTSQCD